MASQVTNYQCPACTGPLQFNPQTGKLGCEFCGSVFELAEIEALYQDKEEQAAGNDAGESKEFSVIIDDEATLKRVYYYPDEAKKCLQSSALIPALTVLMT